MMCRFMSVAVLVFLISGFAGGFEWQGYYHEEKDAQGDVVYFSADELWFYKGKQIDDIDIVSFEASYSGGNITFTLEVKGRIRTEDDYDYNIFGETAADHYSGGYGFRISFSEGKAELTNNRKSIRFDLTDTSSWSGSILMITVPVRFFDEAEIFEIHADTGKFDDSSYRYYKDSTLPLEIYAEDEPSILRGLLFLTGLVAGFLIILYVLFGKRIRLFLKSHLRKRCPNCGVIYRRGTRKCIHCGEKL